MPRIMAGLRVRCPISPGAVGHFLAPFVYTSLDENQVFTTSASLDCRSSERYDFAATMASLQVIKSPLGSPKSGRVAAIGQSPKALDKKI